MRLSRGRGAAADFELTSAEHPCFNPVLPYALAREFGPKVRPESWLNGIDATIRDQRDLHGQVASAHEALTELLGHWRCVPSVEPAMFIGVFNYEYQAMVADLEDATDLMAGHDVLAAMAGHEGAWDRLHEGAAVTAWMPGADDVDPVDEYLVHDADSSQTRAINLVIRGRHTLIDGPPGTGKSQTIANVIASLAARGKSVLFGAAKKVAIEAVTERLADIDLGDLVLDLHGSGSDRRGITQRLNEAFGRAGTRAPVDVQRLHQALKAARSKTNRSPVVCPNQADTKPRSRATYLLVAAFGGAWPGGENAFHDVRQPVRDQDDGAVSGDGPQPGEDPVLRAGVQRGGGFLEADRAGSPYRARAMPKPAVCGTPRGRSTVVACTPLDLDEPVGYWTPLKDE